MQRSPEWEDWASGRQSMQPCPLPTIQERTCRQELMGKHTPSVLTVSITLGRKLQGSLEYSILIVSQTPHFISAWLHQNNQFSSNFLCSLRTHVRVIWIPNTKVIHVLLLTSVRVVVVRVWNWPGSFCVGKIGLKLIFLPCHLQVLLLWWCVSIPSLKNYVLNLLLSDSFVCIFVCMYVWVHVCACVCATRLVWQWEDNLCELVLSFHPVKLRYWT